MLRSLQEFDDFSIRTSDGIAGEVKTFLIDDFEWVVRYAIVEFDDRRVLLATHSIGAPDLNARIFPVKMTMAKVMDSPKINTDLPLTREIERQLSDFFEWPYYWQADDVPNTQPGDLTSIPLINLELDRENQEEAQLKEAGKSTGKQAPENRLHSLERISGSTIHALNDDENGGEVHDLIVEDQDWHIQYLVIDTGGLFSGKKVLLSPNWVALIDEVDSRIDVNLKSTTIQESPDFNGMEDLSTDYQERLSSYYGKK